MIATINEARIPAITTPESSMYVAVFFCFNKMNGINTTIVVRLEASSAFEISSVDCTTVGILIFLVLFVMCSIVIMLLSTTIPIAMAIPDRVIMLSEEFFA
ncbi:MAG: hypothetical protein N3F66_05625 [Spirochaetes bacterium]|nr:hypothetical protein [Spirochaetota bacterium]